MRFPEILPSRLQHYLAHSPASYLKFGLAVWPVYLVVLLLVYSKALTDPLIFDDVAMLLYFRMPHFGWLDCLMPLGNGFIRPSTILTSRLLWHPFGANPLPYHLAALAIHAATATCAAVACCVLAGVSRLAGFVTGLTVALAAAAFPSAYMLSNSCDSYMAIGALLVVINWTLWLRTGRRRYAALAWAGLLFAIAGKESAVAISGFVVLQTWISGTRRRADWIRAGAFFAACVAYAALVTMIQNTNETSYTNAGWVSKDPVFIGRQMISSLAAVVLPGTYIFEPMWHFGRASAVITWTLRGAAGLLLAAAALTVILRKAQPLVVQAAVCYLAAAGMLFPTAMLIFPTGPFSPIGRFLYSAIPLVVLAGACLATQAWPRWRVMRAIGVLVWLIWMVFQVIIVRKSPGPDEYYQTAKENGRFIAEIARLSPAWPPMQAVTVYSGPEYGSRVIPESYGRAKFRVYFPDLLANYYENRTIPETTRAYTFDGDELTPVQF